MKTFKQFVEVMTDVGPNQPIDNEEMSVPAGTTGKRREWHPKMVGIRMADGSIRKRPPGKSGSSGGGGGGGSGGSGGGGGE